MCDILGDGAAETLLKIPAQERLIRKSDVGKGGVLRAACFQTTLLAQ